MIAPFARALYRELFYEKTRILLTIFAIAWGTFAIANMLAIGEGLRLTFVKAVVSAGHNLLTVNGGRTSKIYRGMPANAPVKLTLADLKAISILPGIANATAQYSFGAKMFFQQKNTAAKIKAVAPNYMAIHRTEIGAGGRFLEDIDMKTRAPVIVLGARTNKELFGNTHKAVGEVILIGTRPFKVVGVAQKRAELALAEEPEEYLNWIPTTTYELFANPQSVDVIALTYKDGTDLKQLKAQIRKAVAVTHELNADDISIVDFVDVAKMQSVIVNFFVGMQIFLGILGFLTLLVAGIGIANVMYASITRATREIGVRMALGARTYQIVAHYITESLLATLIGGVIGIVSTMLLVFGLRFIPWSDKLVEVIGKPRPELSPMVLVIVIAVLGLVGFLAGLFPALKAARIDPAEALIYE